MKNHPNLGSEDQPWQHFTRVWVKNARILL